MKLNRAFRLGPLVLVLAGCGGGAGSPGSAGTSPTGTETSFASGELEGRAAISNPPVTTSSAYAVATALTGTFTSLKLKELNPALGESRIYYSDGVNGHSQIVSAAIDGSDVQPITTTNVDSAPSVSASGKIAFTSTRSGSAQIWIMNGDGSNPVQLTTGAGTHLFPSIDAAGDKVVYLINQISAAVVDVTTKAVTPIEVNGVGEVEAAVISPDGNTVYFAFFDGTTSALFKESLNPANSPSFMGNVATGVAMAIAQDGSEIALASNTPPNIERVGTADGMAVNVATAGGSLFGLSYSPDKTQFVCGYEGTNDQTYFIKKLPIVGGPMVPITDGINVAGLPSWGPFVKEHVLIAGGGGMLGTHACGVICGQQANRTTSVVAFDATTPSSVVMTAQTPTNSIAPNLVFSIDADSIVKLAYANSYAWRGIRIIGTGSSVTSANGALISLNAFDGTVVSILPFTGSRAAGSRPTIHDEGTTRVFTGEFLGVFDKDGRNLAPGGASTVKLDTKTGALSVEG